jgi:hypothetical protein
VSEDSTANVLFRHSGASDPNSLLCRSCRVQQFQQRHHGDLAGVFDEAWVEAALVSCSTVVVESAGHGIDSWRVLGAHLTAYLQTYAGLTPWNIARRIDKSCTSMSLASHLIMNITSCNFTPPDFKVEPSTHPGCEARPQDRLSWQGLCDFLKSLTAHHKVGHCFLQHPFPHSLIALKSAAMQCERVFQKLTVAQLHKKCPAFYGTQKFITVWVRWFQPTTPHSISWWFILILPLNLCLDFPGGHFPSSFP